VNAVDIKHFGTNALTISNSVIAGNTIDLTGSGAFASGGFNLIGDGDFNGDGFVGSGDLNQVGIHWRNANPEPAAAPRTPRAPLSQSAITTVVASEEVSPQPKKNLAPAKHAPQIDTTAMVDLLFARPSYPPR